MIPIILSPDTFEEVLLYKDGNSLMIPDEYMHFAVTWSTFNRIYNENCEDHYETQRVIELGDKLDGLWITVCDQANMLSSMECVGGVKDPSGILKPKPEVKSATLFLREFFHLNDAIDSRNCRFIECRPEKRVVCNSVVIQPWIYSKMAALLRLVYQVRCNLVHGDKRLNAQGYQRDRDIQLVDLSNEIIKTILREIGSEVKEE